MKQNSGLPKRTGFSDMFQIVIRFQTLMPTLAGFAIARDFSAIPHGASPQLQDCEDV